MARNQKALTGKALAQSVGVSPSLISKIEHDVVSPSLALLRKISAQLQIPLPDLVDIDPKPESSSSSLEELGKACVVRSDQRRLLHFPDSNLTYQLLTPTLQGMAEFVWVELEPNAGFEQMHRRVGEEYSLVLEGTLHVYIEDEEYVLHKGDCIIFDNSLSHRYKNEGHEKVVWVYVGIPPTL